MNYIDQHVHTEFSIDSKVDLEDYFKLAQARNVSHVSFTDHVDYDSLDYGGLDVEVDYRQILEKGLRLEQVYGVKLNLGVEMGYRKDLEPYIDNYLKGKEYGIVLFSVHQHKDEHFAVSNKTDAENIEIYFRSLHQLLDSKYEYDVITHIGYVFRYLHNKHCYREYKEEYISILQKIIAKELCVEINTKSAMVLGNYDFIDFIIELFASLGGTHLSLGSDCHRTSRYQDGFEEVIEIMKKYNLKTVTEVINREKYLREI